jgi:ATP-dependent DNA helicase RecQ
MSELRQSLRQTFGIERLRSGQDDVIRSVLEGTDTLAIMPTGAGKSLCYQLPALHLEGTTIIVSPLISLMKDQVDKLQEHGLDALQVNSALPAAEQRSALGRIEEEESDFVFTTPERLSDPEFLATLRGTTIDFVVIDEAHCISHWGQRFQACIPGYPLGTGGAEQPARAGAHGDSHGECGGRHHAAARAAENARLQHRHLSAESPVPSRACER